MFESRKYDKKKAIRTIHASTRLSQVSICQKQDVPAKRKTAMQSGTD